eukprot:SAG11_NODE_15318_length_582_cov_0.745342_1_plen_89_part_10
MRYNSTVVGSRAGVFSLRRRPRGARTLLPHPESLLLLHFDKTDDVAESRSTKTRCKHCKVNVDPPNLNEIRHAKFRIQKVLFRAVPSRY